MEGILKKKKGIWFVEDSKTDTTYEICLLSKRWLDDRTSKKYLKDGIEVVYELINKGLNCETKQKLFNESYARLIRIEFETM